QVAIPAELNAMAESLRAKGAPVMPQVLQQIAANPARLAGVRAAFQHIEAVASAGKLANGTPSGPLAADLFGRVGTAERSPAHSLCYARTNHAIFAKHHPAELARIIGQLATTGRVTLAGGDVIQWNPATLAAPSGQEGDFLWGALNHLISNRNMPGTVLTGAQTYASQGQMANTLSRLTGKKHVNVQGASALPFLNEIVAAHGPMLAEYGNHGGSVAQVQNGFPLSLEAGADAPRNAGALGYVVVPESEAKKRNIPVIQYAAGSNNDYI
ncbi:MAG TPA: hypothetical protein VH208_09930, partial [Myxococcaceae bacterium]|nr:hypothetical protein [Myxococcaceae bacterium]